MSFHQSHFDLLRAFVPLAAILAQVGIADVQHLTRLFRQILGTTSGQIRRSLYRD